MEIHTGNIMKSSVHFKCVDFIFTDPIFRYVIDRMTKDVKQSNYDQISKIIKAEIGSYEIIDGDYTIKIDIEPDTYANIVR